MSHGVVERAEILEALIDQELRPFVKRIDSESFYAENYLKGLGKAGLLASANKTLKEVIQDGMYLVEETAKVCMTTAFCLWCHFAALTYLRHTKNEALKGKFLPLLENGEIVGATGLSNPMKYYAGLENIHLSAKKTEGGYLLSGVLPAVSNLGDNHWFGIIAAVDENTRIAGFVSSNAERLTLKAKTEFLAANGSATYSCQFDNVFLPFEQVLAENADEFVEKIRPEFVLFQIPLGLGVTQSSIDSIEKMHQRQNGCNIFLPKTAQASELRHSLEKARKKVRALFQNEKFNWKEVACARLELAYLTLEAVQASMLHNGSAGYLRDCAPSRRLREAYFLANLTPTIKHLEKVLN